MKGNAKIIIRKDYYKKVLKDLRFEAGIFVKAFVCICDDYKKPTGYVKLKGYISAEFEHDDKKDDKKKDIDLDLKNEYFEAIALVAKDHDSDDEWRRKPLGKGDDWEDKDKKDNKKKLILDIKEFIIIQKFGYYPKLTIIRCNLDRDPVRIDRKDVGRKVFDKLNECVKKDYDHEDAKRA